MSRTQYEYYLLGQEHKSILATYEDGVLTELHRIHLMGRFWQDIAINAPIPLSESEVEAKARHYEGLVAVRKVELSKLEQKVAAFCAAYKNHLKIKYVMRKGEAARLEDLPVTAELLKAYFENKEWWSRQPKSITNYASNFNALQQLLNKQPEQAKNKYPMEPDTEFEMKLSGQELMKCRQFWYSKGWRPVKSATGNIIKWNPPAVKAAVILLVLIGFIESGCSIFRAPVVFEIEETVVVEDTVKVKADTAQVLLDLAGTDSVWTFENERTKVEIVAVDSSQVDSLIDAGWRWLDSAGNVVPWSAERVKTQWRKWPKKALAVRVINKPVEVVELDTFRQKQPVPVIVPTVPNPGQVNIWYVISALLAAAAAIFFFIKKRKHGKGDVEADQR